MVRIRLWNDTTDFRIDQLPPPRVRGLMQTTVTLRSTENFFQVSMLPAGLKSK
jgi:hypothetical protein